MARVSKRPICYLALSPAATANALCIEPRKVRAAINDGKLIVRKAGANHRIAVFGKGGVQEWVESWPRIKPKKDRPHVHQ